MKSFRNTRLFWFIKNICCLFRCDVYKELEEIKCKQNNLVKNNFWEIHLGLIKRQIISYYSVNPEAARKYLREIEYIKYNNDLIFPYSQRKKLKEVVCGLDKETNMPYVIHKEKKLFFPSNMSIPFAVNMYKNFIEKECILGDGYREKTPHQYESGTFCVSDGDILLDIGCAEALFSLEHIEKIKKVYLIESDPYWVNALRNTFKPYIDKVIFVNKLISDSETENTTTLSSILKNEINESIFIKMDIEGYELMVLKSSIDILREINNIKIACCTYHRQHDFDEISTLLNNNGFQTESSDGYMVYPQGEIKPPYFRNGVLRAKK